MKLHARLTCLVAALHLSAASIARADGAAAPGPTPTPVDSALPLSGFSAIGAYFAKSNHLTELGWNDAQVAAFIEGIRGAFKGRDYPFDDAARKVSEEMGRRAHEIEARGQQQSFADPAQLQAYMKSVCKRYNLDQSDSGLCYTIQSPGKGNRPGSGDTVVMSCVAVAADGSTKLPQLSGSHFRVKVAELLPGIREGVQMMANTGQALFVLPPALSFGDAPWPDGVDRGTPLIFQVTLHEVLSAGSKAP